MMPQALDGSRDSEEYVRVTILSHLNFHVEGPSDLLIYRLMVSDVSVWLRACVCFTGTLQLRKGNNLFGLQRAVNSVCVSCLPIFHYCQCPLYSTGHTCFSCCKVLSLLAMKSGCRRVCVCRTACT